MSHKWVTRYVGATLESLPSTSRFHRFFQTSSARLGKTREDVSWYTVHSAGYEDLLRGVQMMNPATLMSTISLEQAGMMSEESRALLGREFSPTSPATRSMAKRAIDLVGAAACLILLAPLMLGIAALIRLESRGSIFFRQRRLGLDGRAFWVLKFRTMVPDAERRVGELEALNESAGGVLFKIRRDPRVTRLGRLLRRTSLDELPQLLNILRGEMSLVGPRPLQLRDCERLKAVDPRGFATRLSVPPGLTGPWQIGGRSEEDGQGMMRLDLDYVERWSLGLDLLILCRTLPAVIVGRGAC